MENNNCKDCIQIESIKNQFESFKKEIKNLNTKNYNSIIKLQDRVGALERQGDKNEEKVAMIFNILNEIKDSVRIIADKIDDFERHPPGTMSVNTLKDDMKELSKRIKAIEDKPAKKWDEATKTIFLVVVTQIAVAIFTKLLN